MDINVYFQVGDRNTAKPLSVDKKLDLYVLLGAAFIDENSISKVFEQ